MEHPKKCLRKLPKIKEGLLSERKAEEAVEYMRLLSHPVRLQVVKLLSKQDLCVCVLEAALERTQPNISQHLAKLKDNRIIESYPHGKYTYYHLKDRKILGLIKAFSE